MHQSTASNFNLQPTLKGDSITLRPLQPDDLAETHKAASDPKIWEQHPQSTRYQREVFEKYFEGALDSKGAFAVIDNRTGNIIGSTRYYEETETGIKIGYTFLTRDYWGGKTNKEMKDLLIQHAFKSKPQVHFDVGINNIRSQRALEKLGAKITSKEKYDGTPHLTYTLERP